MKTTINKNNRFEVNGLTFFKFIIELRGYDVVNKNGKIIPKYILFWNGYTIPKIIEKFKLKIRTDDR